MNPSYRWITNREGLHPEMDVQSWILSGDGLRPDINRDWIWKDDQRWKTGDGPQQMDHRGQMTSHLLSYIKLRSYNRAQIWRHMDFQLRGSTKYDAKHYSALVRGTLSCTYISELQWWIWSQIRSRLILLQCWHSRSWSRLRNIVSSATTVYERDDSAGSAITLTTNK